MLVNFFTWELIRLDFNQVRSEKDTTSPSKDDSH